MFNLPSNLQQEIYEYDSTYHELYSVMMLELIEMALLSRYIRMCAYDIIISEKECKKILRNIKKEQLRRLAHLTKTTMPRKITKKRLLMKILFNTCFYTIRPRQVFQNV